MSRPLLALLLVAVAAAPGRAADIDPLVPAKAESFTVYNVRQIIDSPLFKDNGLERIKTFLAKDDEFQQRLKSLALDPLKDIDKVTQAGWIKEDKQQGQLFVAHGRFDPEKFFAVAQAEAKNNGDKLAIVKAGGYKLVRFTLPRPPDAEEKYFYAALGDEHTLVAADDEKQMIETLNLVKEPPAKAPIKKELGLLLLDQDAKASFYSISVMDLTELKDPMGNPAIRIPGVDPERVMGHAEKVKSYALSVKGTDEVTLEFTLGMADAGAAGDVLEFADELIGMATKALPLIALTQPKMRLFADEVGKTLRAKSKGKTMTVTMRLSAEAVGQVFAEQ